MDQTCGLRHPKAVNSGPSQAGAEVDVGRGPDLGAAWATGVSQREAGA